MTTDSAAEIIRTENVTKRFGELVAVDRVNYSLRQNEVAGIIGSNGAGKTTFFNLLTGYYPPDEGIILYAGEDVTRVPPQKRVALGMMRTFQLTSTFDNLKVIDNLVLSFFRAHKRSALVFPASEPPASGTAKKRKSPNAWKRSSFRTCRTGR